MGIYLMHVYIDIILYEQRHFKKTFLKATPSFRIKISHIKSSKHSLVLWLNGRVYIGKLNATCSKPGPNS